MIIHHLGEDFGRDHLILGEQKGGSVVTENAEEGDHWKLWKDSEGGTTQICLENEESRQMLLGGGGITYVK